MEGGLEPSMGFHNHFHSLPSDPAPWDSYLSPGRKKYSNTLLLNILMQIKTPSVSISRVNKTKRKDIQSIDTVWKMLITNKAPLSAARSKGRLDSCKRGKLPITQELQETKGIARQILKEEAAPHSHNANNTEVRL